MSFAISDVSMSMFYVWNYSFPVWTDSSLHDLSLLELSNAGAAGMQLRCDLLCAMEMTDKEIGLRSGLYRAILIQCKQ